MKKIALLHYAYPPNIGGVERVMSDHAGILADLAYDVLILTGSGSEKNEKIKLVEIEQLQSILNFAPVLQKKILDEGIIDDEFYDLSRDIKKKLEIHLKDRDIIIVHNMLTVYRNLAFIHAFWEYAKNHPDKKIIVWVHDHKYISYKNIYDREHIAKSDLEKKLLTNCLPHDNCKYVVVSETFKKSLLSIMKLEDNQLIVIPNGVSIKRFLEIDDVIWELIQEYDLFSAYPVLLSPVNIIERKNIEYSIHVVAELKKIYPDIRLLISGRTSFHRKTAKYLQFLTELIQKFKLAKNIIFLKDTIDRSLNETELHDLYQISDGVLFFSKSENFGIPLLEAALSKIPIFTSRLEVFHEIADGLIHEYDVSQTLPEVVAGQIHKYLTSTKISMQAKHARQNFHLKTIVTKKLLPLF